MSFYRDVDGARVQSVQTSLSLCFYMRRAHREVAPAVMAALEAYREAIQPHLLAWYPDLEGDWQELGRAGWEHNRQKLRHPAGAQLWLRDTPDLTTDYEFRYSGRNVNPSAADDTANLNCAVAFWFPMRFLEAGGPEHFKKLAVELGALLPFNSGHAAPSFYFHESLLGVADPLRELCFRHPGMDLPTMESLPKHLGSQLKGTYWLTFLGAPVLDALGGLSALRARLHSAGTDVEATGPDRALVRLGEWPEAGDLNQGHELPAYRELARVLEPWLYRAPRAPWSGFTEDDVRRWEHRFLE
ncbi:type VI immunity family protein [Pyxidicoccus sp. 3LFB2]